VNQMDDNFLYFLRMVVPVAATLIGFAILGPAVQVVYTIFTRPRICIAWKTVYWKVFRVIALPVLVFFWPFLSSFLLLTFNGDLHFGDVGYQPFIAGASLGFGVVFCVWFWRVREQAEIEEPPIIKHILGRPPLLVFIGYAFYALKLLIIQKLGVGDVNFPLFIRLTDSVFLGTGFLILMWCLLYPVHKGIRFKASDLDQRDPGGYVLEVEEGFKNMEKDLRHRDEAINQLKRLLRGRGKEDEWHPRIAKYRSELLSLDERYNGPEDGRFEGLGEQWRKFWPPGDKDKHFTLSKIFDFEEQRQYIMEQYLPEFERGTKELELLVERLGEERESDK